MNALRKIPHHVRHQQIKATNPEISVWVSANAGSGKTHVLVQRVLRLLLNGVAPAKILCLTFTKAAAANMAERVFSALAEWTELDDARLAQAIVAVGAPAPQPEILTFARRLFARTVETPGGLKIHTIHGFCERLLHLFPFEANVPSRFEVIDEVSEAELLGEARKYALAVARADSGDLGRALQRLAAETSGEEFDALIQEAIKHRALLRHYAAMNAAADLGRALGVPQGITVAAIEREMLILGPARWCEFADILQTGSSRDRRRAALLRKAAEDYVCGHTEACLSSYCEIFFTQKGGRRASVATQALTRIHPGVVADLLVEQERLHRLCALRDAADCFERSVALTTIVGEIFARYEHIKAARGKLDFDDLIERTLALFERSDARWVLFKLDSGIDHILVDEAQDTSREQWLILEALVGEFSAGEGARATPRTFFAVGDEKQSIFSFQGAAPHMFHEMRRRFDTAFRNGGHRFDHIRLKDSFRSSPTVLAAVDRVFARSQHQKGLVTDDVWMGHEAVKQSLPGLIEIWPPLGAAPSAEPRDWRLPLDMLDARDPANTLAERVAHKINMLLAPTAHEYVYDSKQERFRPVSPGDILILVRKRGPLFEALIRALKQNRVPVAGADRLDLTHHIAVMDLIAAGHVALLPQDDLTLASLLKSPLFGLDDGDLMNIAPGRPGSLFDALGASPQPEHRAAHAMIRRWMSRVALSPFNFYARILSEDGGRRAIETRLGAEACDAMDEFIRLALRAEKEGTLSLPAFLAEIENLDLSIKRDMEASSDHVRVMTIHAAKGLEAKIVFLPDTCSTPNAQHDPKIHLLQGQANARRTLAWSSSKDDDPPAVEAARQAAREEAEDEHRRLLYVAMTRAEERLYISGFHGAQKPGNLAWSSMIAASLGDDFVEVPAFWDSTETILRHESGPSIQASLDFAAPILVPEKPSLPAYLLKRIAPEAVPPPPIKPSTALAAAEEFYDRDAIAPREALERGRLIHVLVEHLPDVAPEARRKTARAFLAARAGQWGEDAHAALIDEALAVLEAPDLQGLFGPRGRAEVAISGRVTLASGQARDVVGQVDRLAETETDVIVADYKTGIPCAAEATPQAYLTQMALYRAVLAQLWPGKRLRMLLIWTAGPKVVELAEAQMDAALSAVLRLGVV